MNIPATRYSLVMDSPLGRIGVLIADRQIRRLDYLDASTPLRAASGEFGHRVVRQLENYFGDSGNGFTLPCSPAGTPFQQRVWKALMEIPPGETRTYGELAAGLGSGARAVGNACRRNPVSIIVPCHRVVSARGIGGYSGRTSGPALERKRWLLEHEKPPVPALKKPVMAPNSHSRQQYRRSTPA